jgi:phage terminase small subunit
MTELTEKQKAFCLEYVKDYNGKQAAIRAGYSSKTASVMASKLLTKGKVRDEVNHLQDELIEDASITKEYIIQQLKDVVRRATKSNRLADKNRALELLGKHIGAWEADNLQKAPVQQTAVVLDAGASLEALQAEYERSARRKK